MPASSSFFKFLGESERKEIRQKKGKEYKSKVVFCCNYGSPKPRSFVSAVRTVVQII